MKMLKIPQRLNIFWLRDKYREGILNPEDVILEIIRRVEQDKGMNIWITPPSMTALKPYLERLKDLDKTSYPLWGIPFAIKDNIDLAGIETTAGCPQYSYMPKGSAPVVTRLIEAGAIPVGKTNLDQFATGLVGTRSPYGETHNALNAELISGGSSSGSAVAVARGHAAFSLGTDTAGSGRVPAALNEIIGFKPSMGAWPTRGIVPACESLDCASLFTHDTAEALLVDTVVRGVEESDPWSRHIPHPAMKSPHKICLPKGKLDFYGPYAEHYKRSWEETLERIKTLHLPIEYVDEDIFKEAADILYEGPWVAERWAALGAFVEAYPDEVFPVTADILRTGADSKYDAASVFKAIHKLQAIRLATRKLLKNAVLVLPTCGGTWTRAEVKQNPVSSNREMGRYTNHCNLLDLCALAVPAQRASENLPFGITFFALSENEDFLFGAAAHFLQNKAPVLSKEETTEIAVCGLHMRGFPLEKQMLEHGAAFVREAKTAPAYQFIKLNTSPEKPGLIKKTRGGTVIELELWEMPLSSYGDFVSLIPAPLGIGTIDLEDGSQVQGFICEAYAAEDADDITSLGSWRKLHKLKV